MRYNVLFSDILGWFLPKFYISQPNVRAVLYHLPAEYLKGACRSQTTELP